MVRWREQVTHDNLSFCVFIFFHCRSQNKAFPENCLWLKFIDIFVRKHPVLCSFFNIPQSDCTHAAQKIPRLSVWQTAKLIHLPDRKLIHLPDGKKTTAWHFPSSINSQINPYLLSSSFSVSFYPRSSIPILCNPFNIFFIAALTSSSVSVLSLALKVME